MPISSVISPRLTKARKTQLIRDIVKVTHESIGSDPSHQCSLVRASGRQHEHLRTKSTAERPEAGRGEGASLSRVSVAPAQPGRLDRSAAHGPNHRRDAQCERHRWICVTSRSLACFLKVLKDQDANA